MNKVLSLGISIENNIKNNFFVIEKKETEELFTEITNIISYLEEENLNNNERKSIDSNKGIWHIIKLKNRIYFCLTINEYPARLAYLMLNVF